MKASEVLRRYAVGERDFCGMNLRSQSFKGKELSQADFTGADIRGANFTNAILRGANFSNSKAGWLPGTVIGILFFSLILAILSGFTSGSTASIAVHSFTPEAMAKAPIPAGLVSLAVLAVFFFTIINKGIETAFIILAVALTIAFPISPTGALIAAIALLGFWSGALAVGMSLFVIGSKAGYTIVCGSIITSTILVLYWAFTNQSEQLGSILHGRILFALVFSAIIPLIFAYVAGSALDDDEKFSFLKKAIIFCGVLGHKTSFNSADLEDTNFSEARLAGTDISKANITHTFWKNARGLDYAKVDGTILDRRELRQLLTTLNGRNKNFRVFDLSRVNLQGVDLTNANLRGANLNRAILRGAFLEQANLSEVQCLATDFRGAFLTGACLENWNINKSTNLKNVNCDYIYLKQNGQERRPSFDFFEQGDFTRLFEKAMSTVDLIFRDGIDWKAFASSLQQLREEPKINQKLKIVGSRQELSIRAIETRDDGSFVIRVNIPSLLDKSIVEALFKKKYKKALNFIQESYKKNLNAKQEQIEIYRKHNTDLERLMYTLANTRTPVEIKFDKMGDTYNIGGGTFGVGINQGEIKDNAQVSVTLNESQKHNLAEAAAEIQQLIEQISPNYLSNTTAEQMVIAAQAIEQIESDPNLKQKVINAAKEGGLAAFEKALDNPIGALITGAIKGWLEAKTD